jgi:hypothetical protein
MVTPPALMAAIQVGATIAIFLEQFCNKYFKKVVLPVPAFPVKNKLRVVKLIYCAVFCAMGDNSVFIFNFRLQY